MADYWQHWIDIGATLDADKAPKIFNVNWFRKDDEGNFMWPGFGVKEEVPNSDFFKSAGLKSISGEQLLEQLEANFITQQ